ncbi:hypothetical protein MD484_g4034, partial [Candolleomyces efflorescens]
MAFQPTEDASYIVTASTISSTTQKSPMDLFAGIFQRFRGGIGIPTLITCTLILWRLPVEFTRLLLLPTARRFVFCATIDTAFAQPSSTVHRDCLPPPPPIWPPPDLLHTSSNAHPSSHSNAVAGPSTAAAGSMSTRIPRGRGVRRPAPMEYAQPPPPPKSMAKPPMKQWQRRRPITRAQLTSNQSSSSTAVSPQGPSSSSSASRLAKIDLQVQVARGMMRTAFQKFREMFRYEVADAEDIYDNPLECSLIRRKPGGTDLELMVDVDETQPTIVTHRLYWQGADELVPEALSLALDTSLSNLTITNCNLAMTDVVAILLLCPSLQSLEVKQISGAASPISQLSSRVSPDESSSHGLRSLVVSSLVPIQALFNNISFPWIQFVSLRLYGEGRWSDFDFVAQLPRSLDGLRLRGDIPPASQALIKRAVGARQKAFEFDFAPLHEAL